MWPRRSSVVPTPLSLAPGIDLTPEQHAKAIAALRPLVEKYKSELNSYRELPEPLRADPSSPEAKKAMGELRQKSAVAAQAHMKVMREAVEAVLTDKQKQRLKETQSKP